MTQNPNPPLIEPLYPEEWACCDSGCGESCVYEIYRREKAEYDAQIKQQQNQKQND